jgi:hypothetical protein
VTAIARAAKRAGRIIISRSVGWASTAGPACREDREQQRQQGDQAPRERSAGRQQGRAVCGHGLGPPARTTPMRHERFCAANGPSWSCRDHRSPGSPSEGCREPAELLEAQLPVPKGEVQADE